MKRIKLLLAIAIFIFTVSAVNTYAQSANNCSVRFVDAASVPTAVKTNVGFYIEATGCVFKYYSLPGDSFQYNDGDTRTGTEFHLNTITATFAGYGISQSVTLQPTSGSFRDFKSNELVVLNIPTAEYVSLGLVGNIQSGQATYEAILTHNRSTFVMELGEGESTGANSGCCIPSNDQCGEWFGTSMWCTNLNGSCASGIQCTGGGTVNVGDLCDYSEAENKCVSNSLCEPIYSWGSDYPGEYRCLAPCPTGDDDCILNRYKFTAEGTYHANPFPCPSGCNCENVLNTYETLYNSGSSCSLDSCSVDLYLIPKAIGGENSGQFAMSLQTQVLVALQTALSVLLLVVWVVALLICRLPSYFVLRMVHFGCR
jgi:hypothetical protein